jgi:tetratricopeptide (TPR) repeat protein
MYEDISARPERQLGAQHPETALARVRYGGMLLQLDRADDALAQLARADALCKDASPELDVLCGDVRRLIGEAKLQRKAYVEADDHLTRALAAYERVQTGDSVEIVATLWLLGESMRAQGRRDDAVKHLRRALAMATSGFDADHPDLARTRFELAQALGEGAEARGLAQQALDVYKSRPNFRPEAAAVETWLVAHPA